MNVIDFKPSPTVKEFILDYRPGELFYSWIVGPFGAGKTTGNFFKLIYMSKLQQPSADGVRRSRCVIVRNTAPQLKDTTIKSWSYWFQEGQAGHWNLTERVFNLKFSDVECEVLFRPLDTEQDIARVLSLDVTFAIVDEFVEIPKKIIEALSARLGRYPPKKTDTPATNWGMWGASNTSTEDNWWFDYLIKNEDNVQRIYLNKPEPRDSRNVRYFVQPSGNSPEAENLEFLPGGRGYYDNLAKGKSEAWIKQFIDVEWGFSVSGKPVVATFNSNLHVAKGGLRWNSQLPLVAGFDPGLAGSALIFGQLDHSGRLNVLGELVQSNYGAQRLIKERLRPYLMRRFPGARLIIAPDPASGNRSQTDEKPFIDEFKRHFDVKMETNNRLSLRLDAIDAYTTKLVEAKPALLIDEQECPVLCRALRGGWRFVMDVKKEEMKGPVPEKNPYSHAGDGFGYLCRYFHRLTEREMRYASNGAKPFVPPRTFGPKYHFQ